MTGMGGSCAKLNSFPVRPLHKGKNRLNGNSLVIPTTPSALSDGDMEEKDVHTPSRQKSKKSLVSITYCRFNKVFREP